MKNIIKLSTVFTFLVLLLVNSCGKENCSEAKFKKIELKIYSGNQNITNEYVIDSVLISRLDCVTPGQSGTRGIPREHNDSVLIYDLVYCCFEDSSRFLISFYDVENVVDTFIIFLDDLDPNCEGCSVVNAKSLTQNSILNHSQEKISILLSN